MLAVRQEVSKQCRIYRISHIDNLAGVIEQGGFWCGRAMNERELPYRQIGLQSLTLNRGDREVDRGPKGYLSDYVPFHFCPRSVMLFQIHTRMVPTYLEGQEPILHFISSVEKIHELGLPYVFTDRHAKIKYAGFFEDAADLSRLDWPTIKSRTFAGTEEDPERPTRKQAEFLVHQFVPLAAILGIGVYSQKWKDDCIHALSKARLQIPVEVKTSWYY